MFYDLVAQFAFAHAGNSNAGAVAIESATGPMFPAEIESKDEQYSKKTIRSPTTVGNTILRDGKSVIGGNN
jgi:hypothetical protein